MHRRSRFTVIALAALFPAWHAAAQDERTSTPPSPLPKVDRAGVGEDGPFSRETPATYIARKTRGAVVMLRAMQTIPARLPSDEAGRTTNLGAGIVFDSRGYVVTNYHVVQNVQKINAVLTDGRKTTARRVNFDAKADLAVLKLDDPGPYPVVSLSDGVTAIEGEWAIAIGNPFGLGNSLAWGIVSHVERDMKLPNNEMAHDLIQVSAAINPGNSGGPLFNVNGQLLGITSAIRSNAQGIAFAITSRRVMEVVKSLMPSPISLSTMGLAVRESGEKNTKTLVQVAHVDEGSPAALAGLITDDTIIGVDNEIIRNSFDLERALWDRSFGQGQRLSLKVKAKGRERSIEMPIESMPGKLSHAELVWTRMGIWALEIPASRVKHINPDYRGGLLVVNVAPGSYAAQAGLLPGDVVLGVIPADGQGLETIEAANFTYIMREKPDVRNTMVKVLVMRDGELAPHMNMFLPADRDQR